MLTAEKWTIREVRSPEITVPVPGAELEGEALTAWLAGREPAPGDCPLITPKDMAEWRAQEAGQP